MRSWGWLLTLVLGLLLLTGCSTGSEENAQPGSLAVVVGARSNMVAPSVVDAVQAEINTASDRGSPCTVIIADGAPSASEPVSLKARNDNPLLKQDQVNQLQNVIERARADTAEVDLLAAIALAARSVADVNGPKTIVVIDSGLQTAGALRFQDEDGSLLDADPAEVADYLRRTQQLPDLTGIRMVFVGLGDTALPQQPLPTPARAALVELWRTILEQAGGNLQIKEAPLPGDRKVGGLPPVATVPVAAEVSGPPPRIRVLRDSTVGFVPNQAVFRNPDQARAVVAPYAAAIKRGQRALLTGTTAAVGDLAGQVRLSLQRANAVRDLLVELGAPAELIQTRGLGSDFPGYVLDRDAAGNLDPVRAAQNRQVVIELLP